VPSPTFRVMEGMEKGSPHEEAARKKITASTRIAETTPFPIPAPPRRVRRPAAHARSIVLDCAEPS